MARLARTFAAVDPNRDSDLKTLTIGLEQRQIDALLHEDGSSNDKVRLWRLLLAQEVAEDPVAIFEGWNRPEHSDGLCYCGKPKSDYRGPHITTPPPPNMVFCVFVTASGKISDWRWEVCDKFEPEYPEDWQNRFGRIAWPLET